MKHLLPVRRMFLSRVKMFAIGYEASVILNLLTINNLNPPGGNFDDKSTYCVNEHREV